MSKISLAIALAVFASFTPGALAAETPLQSAIDYVRAEGSMTDTADGTFSAEQEISRADTAYFLVRELYAGAHLDSCFAHLAPSLPPSYTYLFSDVSREAWYAKQLCVGMLAGVINGNRDGSFHPLAGITAAEASKMFAHAYGLTAPAKLPSGKPWYAASMEALQNAGALPAAMQPATILTRGDLARIFYALRNQERFPVIRIIAEGNTPPVADTAATTSATSRRGERISRRTLLLREYEKTQGSR